MLRSLPYRALAAATLGQFVAYLAVGVLEALVIPCCDNPTPDVPRWYTLINTPAHFAAMLLPAFVCGLYVLSRPIVVGTIAAFVGRFLWQWWGNHLLAWLFPARAISGIGQFESALVILSDPFFLSITVIWCACYGAAAAGAASGGYVLRGRAP